MRTIWSAQEILKSRQNNKLTPRVRGLDEIILLLKQVGKIITEESQKNIRPETFCLRAYSQKPVLIPLPPSFALT